MSERMLEIVRDGEGRFLATADERHPAIEVSSWDDVRRLRGKTHLVDHWADGVRDEFIALHGHPFDDWWATLTPACAKALREHPHAEVPPAFQSEVKRAITHQAKQAGLELSGSSLSRELQEYVAARPAAG
jgi:hypothetical protein